VVAAAIATAAPGIAASATMWSAQRSSATVDTTGPSEAEESLLIALRGSAGELARLGGERSITMVIAPLAKAPPPNAVLQSLRTDSIGGGLSILAGNVEETVRSIQAIPEVKGAELVGSVTPAQVAGSARYRAEVRFSWRDHAPVSTDGSSR